MQFTQTASSTGIHQVDDVRSARRKGLPHALMMAVLTMGFTAFIFGGLLTVTTLGMPISMLDRSPFSSFVIPGLILCFVVGGSELLAARLIWFEHRLAPQAAFASGCILFGWIAVEAIMIPGGLFVQIPFGLYGLGIVAMSWIYHRRVQPSRTSNT